jgi:hypothetical protein
VKIANLDEEVERSSEGLVMLTILPFVIFIFGVFFLALIVWLKVRGGKINTARRARLESLGFVACPAEQPFLVETVTWLENNSEYRYAVDHPFRASLHGKPIYYFTKSRHRHANAYCVDDLMLSLKRPSDAGLKLFFKPSNLPAGIATRLIDSVVRCAWDSQPDDLAEMPIPVDLQGTNLIGALGPSQALFHDLIDASTLSTLMHVGDCSVMAVTCRGTWCSFSSTSIQAPMEVTRLWSLVSKL